MTDDETAPLDLHVDYSPEDNARFLKLRVISQTGRSYLCNRIGWDEDTNNRVLYGAYSTSDPYRTDGRWHPVDIVIDGGIDAIPLQRGQWILPKCFVTPDETE